MRRYRIWEEEEKKLQPAPVLLIDEFNVAGEIDINISFVDALMRAAHGVGFYLIIQT